MVNCCEDNVNGVLVGFLSLRYAEKPVDYGVLSNSD